MIKIFLDTNVLLDWVLDREGAREVGGLFERSASDDDKVRLYASFLSMANIAYIIRKQPEDVVLRTIKTIMRYVNVLGMDDMLLRRLQECTSPDIEDRMQILCAEYGRASLILTNNVPHFKNHTDIPVMSIKEFASVGQ